jgi:hypothetical protein
MLLFLNSTFFGGHSIRSSNASLGSCANRGMAQQPGRTWTELFWKEARTPRRGSSARLRDSVRLAVARQKTKKKSQA